MRINHTCDIFTIKMCAVYHIENTGVPGKKNKLEVQTPKMASFLSVKSSDPAGARVFQISKQQTFFLKESLQNS